MGRSAQPYMYDAPRIDDNFDPRAFSRRSWAPPPPPKPKNRGPLLEPSHDFNKHPDSYVIEKYGNIDAKPMGPRTKKAIKQTRWAQLGFRVIELVGAVGLLICVICIKGAQDAEGWIMRIPPGADIFATLYAIYHLCRPANGRTPMSSASYHFFAAFVDTGAIPFYVFTAMLANTNLQKAPGSRGRWRSFFSSIVTTNLIFQVTWLAAAVMAGLHVISLSIDLYLVIMFRKISKLPPDMNPLEDNLTSRHKKSKHKYKDSDATLAESFNVKSVKRISEMSASTLSVHHQNPDRNSKMREPLLPDVQGRDIPFIHTRNASTPTFNPHNPRTARLSQAALGDERGRFMPDTNSVHSARASRMDFSSVREPTLAEIRSSLVNGSAASLVPPAAARPYAARDSQNTLVSAISKQEHDLNRHSPVSPIMDDPKQDNWFVPKNIQSSPSPDRMHSHRKSQYDFEYASSSDEEDQSNVRNSGTVRRPKSYQPVPQSAHIEATSSLPPMRPLGMNPPSPVYPLEGHKEKDSDAVSLDSGSHYSQSTTVTSVPSAPSHVRNNSIGTDLRHSATPKGRYYGDLASATRGIRRGNSPAPPSSSGTDSSAAPAPIIPRHKANISTPEKRQTWLGAGLAAAYDYTSAISPSARGRNGTATAANPNLYSTDRNPYLQQAGWGEASQTSTASPYPTYSRVNGWNDNSNYAKEGSPRVVSRTGADYSVAMEANGRRRDVSGKVAEEGRGGSGWGGTSGPGGWGMRGRRVSAGAS